MDNKETIVSHIHDTALIKNEQYFKYIFKKTEKIVCAVFYVTRSESDNVNKDKVVASVEDTAERLMDTVLRSLRATEGSRALRAEEVGYALIELESKLAMLHASGVLPEEHIRVFVSEIDAVNRSLKQFMTHRIPASFGATMTFPGGEKREVRPRILSRASETGESAGMSGAESALGRRDRILRIIKEKGSVTIKDISEQVTDCSEKTIQRELTALIKDGVVVREGERRWSKYAISNSSIV